MLRFYGLKSIINFVEQLIGNIVSWKITLDDFNNFKNVAFKMHICSLLVFHTFRDEYHETLNSSIF